MAKALPIRLGRVMDKLVVPNQLVLFKSRLLVDGMVVVNEVVDLARRPRKSVDFEKAYDSINCNFMDYMLVRFGFNEKWRSWV